jgi:hypothetical protein
MRRLMLLVPVLALSTVAFANASVVKWPAWLSIESPVNPFDRDNAGALMLVHAMTREGPAKVADLNGTAQGIVNGARRSVPIRFDTTRQPGIYAVRKQWPSEGTWLVQIALFSTTAIVVIDHQGDVASVRVPTELQKGNQIPRAVAAKEIDSTLAAAARR